MTDTPEVAKDTDPADEQAHPNAEVLASLADKAERHTRLVERVFPSTVTVEPGGDDAR